MTVHRVSESVNAHTDEVEKLRLGVEAGALHKRGAGNPLARDELVGQTPKDSSALNVTLGLPSNPRKPVLSNCSNSFLKLNQSVLRLIQEYIK